MWILIASDAEKPCMNIQWEEPTTSTSTSPIRIVAGTTHKLMSIVRSTLGSLNMCSVNIPRLINCHNTAWFNVTHFLHGLEQKKKTTWLNISVKVSMAKPPFVHFVLTTV